MTNDDMVELHLINKVGTRSSFFVEKFEVKNLEAEFRAVAEGDELFCRRVYARGGSSFIPYVLYIPYEALVNSMLLVSVPE